MKLTAQFEQGEAVPPLMAEQIGRAIAHAVEAFGLTINLHWDSGSMGDAVQAYWDWRAAERAKYRPHGTTACLCQEKPCPCACHRGPPALG